MLAYGSVRLISASFSAKLRAEKKVARSMLQNSYIFRTCMIVSQKTHRTYAVLGRELILLVNGAFTKSRQLRISRYRTCKSSSVWGDTSALGPHGILYGVLLAAY